VADDPALRQMLTAAAYDDVQARFSWPTALRQYRQLLNLDAK
jgi:hypothetical protein